MNGQLTPRDWETLSAYLDGQLSEREQRQLSQKLAVQPELQRALDELQRTRMILRSAPRRRAPRNFTLSPSMVRQPRRSWFQLVPTFSVTSALAAILLVFSFGFELIAGLTPTRATFTVASAPKQEAEPTQAARAVEKSAVQPSAVPPMIVWGPAYGMGGGGGGGSGGSGGVDVPPGMGIGGGEPSPEIQPAQPLAPSPGPSMLPDATVYPTQPPKPTAQPLAPTPGPSMLPDATVYPTQPPRPTAQPTAAPADRNSKTGEGMILGISPTEERGKMVVPSPDAPLAPLPPSSTAQDSAAPRGFNFNNLRGVQIVLVVVALAAGIAALLLRRKGG